jgi:hypothetical protein
MTEPKDYRQVRCSHGWVGVNVCPDCKKLDEKDEQIANMKSVIGNLLKQLDKHEESGAGVIDCINKLTKQVQELTEGYKINICDECWMPVRIKELESLSEADPAPEPT